MLTQMTLKVKEITSSNLRDRAQEAALSTHTVCPPFLQADKDMGRKVCTSS